MTPADKLFYGDSVRTGWICWEEVEFTLPAGRRFRYKMKDYPFQVDWKEWEIDTLVTQIIRDKFKYSQWDREHPRTNTEAEIYEGIKQWIYGEIAKVKRLREEEAKKNM
jgi:hypothetical protein